MCALSRWTTLIFSVVLAFDLARAADFVVPELTGPVVDGAGVLSPATRRVVSDALHALHQQGGSQITVLTLRSLEGMPIEQASIRIVDRWKLGGKKQDNGVLLLIAPKERKLRIEVGQGLEGVLTDADSNRIIFQSMVPLLKSGDLDSAVIVGVYQIAKKTDPNFDLAPYLEGHVKNRQPARGEGSRFVLGDLDRRHHFSHNRAALWILLRRRWWLGRRRLWRPVRSGRWWLERRRWRLQWRWSLGRLVKSEVTYGR